MPDPAPAPVPAPKKPLPTSSNMTNLVNKVRNKGGRPSNAAKAALLKDESQAFESIKEKWNYISHKLADEASKAARDTKKIDGRSLVALTTAAGIAYDKRWSKQVSDNTEIDIPASLASAIACKVAKPLIDNDSQCMIQVKSCNDPNEQGNEPIDPMLLSPGL